MDQIFQIVKFQHKRLERQLRSHSEDQPIYLNRQFRQRDHRQRHKLTLMARDRLIAINLVLQMELGATFRDQHRIQQERHPLQPNTLTINQLMALTIMVQTIQCN